MYRSKKYLCKKEDIVKRLILKIQKKIQFVTGIYICNLHVGGFATAGN